MYDKYIEIGRDLLDSDTVEELSPEGMEFVQAAIDLMRAANPKPCKGCGLESSCYWMWDAQRKCCPDCSCTDPREDIAAARAEGYAQARDAWLDADLEGQLAAAKAEIERLRIICQHEQQTVRLLTAKLNGLRSTITAAVEVSLASPAAYEASR